MSGLLDEKMAAAGVTLLYLTRVVDVMQEGGRITHLVLHNKSGFSAVPGPLREQAPCMAMGQAAGTAASLVPAGTGFAEVDVPALRQRLRDQRHRRLRPGLERRLLIRSQAGGRRVRLGSWDSCGSVQVLT